MGQNVISVHLVGEAAPELEDALGSVRAHDDETLDVAVSHAAAEARPGSVVLLSPACASYDQYDNFERRGEHFKRLVAALVTS
jgi:UDP-N-acetylmuramoylalanine--D-glutamate ligase